MDTLDSKFSEMKFFHFSKKQIFKGFAKISRIQKPRMYLKIVWELFTTFIVYSPSINNYLTDIIKSIKDKWEALSENEKVNIIAALTCLNKHGEVEKALRNN